MGDARECVSTVFLPAFFLRAGRKTHAKRVQCAYLSLDRNNHRNLTASRPARAKTESARSDRKREFPQTLSLSLSRFLPQTSGLSFAKQLRVSFSPQPRNSSSSHQHRETLASRVPIFITNSHEPAVNISERRKVVLSLSLCAGCRQLRRQRRKHARREPDAADNRISI